ncbi:PAS domain-containing protein [Hymenobacter endophyticus]|uniref:histidine kinase n=1 Tax=Hymenobacter endophyticus TaxID=3076335 RepID=A0ABU3TH89_9BACT|nr:PAS domain-containing protein [Hymenobacter endophyticus]MDU0370729.1 PAS domain-containing protein [Hymenobacter endophyticus]
MSPRPADTSAATPDSLLQTALAWSAVAMALLRPTFRAGSPEPVDFVYDYLNPAAQQLLQLPERPTRTHAELYSGNEPGSVFSFYQNMFRAEAGTISLELDGYTPTGTPLHIVASRHAEVLLVRFSVPEPPSQTQRPAQPTTPLPPVATENQATGQLEALHQQLQAARQQLATLSQGLAQTRSEAETQRQHLHQLFMQAPACIATLEGPDLVFTLVNPLYQELVGERLLLGRPLRQAWPDLEGQPFFDLLEGVYRTGETYHGREQIVYIDRSNSGRPEPVYFNFTYQAIRSAARAVTGITIFAYDISPQVLAHQQVQHLNQRLGKANEELAATNEELQASNEEFHLSNAELQRTQHQLQLLNQELETRVSLRTQETQAARAEAERQRAHLQRLFMQAPAAICILRGPKLVYELVNPAYQQLFPGRELLGKPILTALPEIQEHAVYHTFRGVYETGQMHQELSMLIPLAHPTSGVPQNRYFNYIQQAYYNEQGAVDGVVVFAFEVTEQVQARQASEASARQLELITDALPVLISYIDHTETYRFVNKAYEHWWRDPTTGLVGRPVRDVIGEPAYQKVRGYLEQVMGGERVDFETRLTYTDGTRRHVQASYVPDVQNGQVVGAVAVVNDVTALVEARQDAERQQQLLHKLFMEAPAPIVILDGPEFVYQLVNPAYQRIFPGRELLGKPMREALPEVVGTFVYEVLEQVYSSGETAVFQEVPLRLARHEGGPLEEIFWTFTYQARRNADAGVDGIVVFAHEVTDQVQARRVLERNEQYLRQMANNVPSMIWVTDTAGQCIYLNQQWYDYTGQTEATGLGRGWLDAVHPDDLQATYTTFEAAAFRQAPFSLLYRLRRQDGRYRWAIDSGLPRFTHTGEFDGFVGTVFDIHEQKQGEQALQRLTTKLRTARDRAEALNADLQASNEQLRRTNVDLDNFIYTASHDLKAPITNIEGLVYLMQDQLPTDLPLTAELQPVLAMMQAAVERFKRTIEHLSDVTKLQREFDRPAQDTSLAPVVEDVCQDLQPLIQATGAEVEINVTDCASVPFSAKNLRSVVYNLLSNALKYHRPTFPPQVQISCRTEEAFVVLEVQDNGLGIEESRQPEMFQMFRRFHAHVEGSGIGLYMVKRVVENAGGHIQVRSQPGAGATFTVYFRR